LSNLRYDGRQKQIEDAALHVFTELGFEKLTLESVAEKLGYTKQAIYYYFKNKEELISSFCLNILKGARDEVVGICLAKEKPEAIMTELIRYYVHGTCLKQGFFALHHDLKQILSAINDENKKKEMYLMMAEIPDCCAAVIRSGIKSGVFRKEDPNALSGAVFALLGGVVSITEIQTLKELSIDKKVELITDIILRGIKV
jgi:TetR/AcrR family transcriptional regulator, cholesterol catabolism regulator